MVSGIFLSEWVDTGVIVAIVVLNAVLGYVQESKSRRGAGGLEGVDRTSGDSDPRWHREAGAQRRARPRGPHRSSRPETAVAADARVIDSVHMEAEEASLTGGVVPGRQACRSCWVPMPAWAIRARWSSAAPPSQQAAVEPSLPRRDRSRRWVGSPRCSVPRSRRPPLEVELGHVGRRLSLIAVGTAVVVFAVGLARGNEAEAMLLIAVALAVGRHPRRFAGGGDDHAVPGRHPDGGRERHCAPADCGRGAGCGDRGVHR